MGHNGRGLNLYGGIITLMGYLHAGGQISLGRAFESITPITPELSRIIQGSPRFRHGVTTVLHGCPRIDDSG